MPSQEEQTVDLKRMLNGSARDHRDATKHRVRLDAGLPLYQTRICARCGRPRTFELRDPAGWYACLECGRFA